MFVHTQHVHVQSGLEGLDMATNLAEAVPLVGGVATFLRYYFLRTHLYMATFLRYYILRTHTGHHYMAHNYIGHNYILRTPRRIGILHHLFQIRNTGYQKALKVWCDRAGLFGANVSRETLHMPYKVWQVSVYAVSYRP